MCFCAASPYLIIAVVYRNQLSKYIILILIYVEPNARVFKFRKLDTRLLLKVIGMVVLCQRSCFLASTCSHGLKGKHLKLNTLKNASIEEIKKAG